MSVVIERHLGLECRKEVAAIGPQGGETLNQEDPGLHTWRK